MKRLIYAFITLKLDLCNSLLPTISKRQLQPINHPQRYHQIVPVTGGFELFSPLMQKSHGLLVKQRNIKILYYEN